MKEKNMHPADEIRGTKSKILSEKQIILGITGSIAAVETIKLARELIRHGAKVTPVMTPNSTKIIHPDAVWFATGKKPIIELTGATEHVTFCGQVKKPADLLLICPCTANTLSKIAHGIDDTSVTTFATTALGSKTPILIVPAMHLSMYNHKIIQENIKKCKKNGIKFIEPEIEKNKAKLPEIDEITANVIRETNKKKLSNKKILIIGGPTSEPVDDVRVITNRSSGKTAIFIAKNAFYQGAQTELWYGKTACEKPPGFIKTTFFETTKDLLQLINKSNLKKYDIIFLCAAISDYLPKKQKGKIPSGKNKLTLELKPSQKIIKIIREKTVKTKIIAFKLETKKEELLEEATKLLKQNNIDYVIGNTIKNLGKNENEIWIFSKNRETVHRKDKKENLAGYILNFVK